MSSANDSASAKEIFLTALEKDSPETLGCYLDEACGENAELRGRVEQLLRAHERAGKFLGGAAATEATIEQPALGFLSPAARPGSLGRIKHYEIQEVVGHGGMGLVLKAFDEKLQRVVAIKVMAESLAASPTARRRFIREAVACAAVRDEHVIGIHEVEDAHQPPYLVMDYISGQSLQQRIDQGGPLSIAEILRIGMQTAAGLAAAHAQGLIHRDVKPANILLENGVQRVKITDFGLARLVDDASVTQTGVVAGTPQYMSPEQARGEAVDHRTDLFSLGSVLYAMCTGQAPFRGSTTVAVLRRVVDESPRPIREINPEIPERLVQVIGKLLAKQPAERFQTAGEVAELLERELLRLQQPGAERTVVSAPLAGGDRWRRYRALAAALVLLVAACLALTEITGVTSIVAGWKGKAKSSPSASSAVGSSVPDRIKFFESSGRGTGSIASPVEQSKEGPFVILGRDGQPQEKFATLAEAVARRAAGESIEVRGNGPFECEPLVLDQPLILRAGTGFQPVLKLSPKGVQEAGTLFNTSALLVLEGLDLHVSGRDRAEPPWPHLIHSQSPLYLANCRLLIEPGAHAVEASPVCELRNCLCLVPAAGLSYTCNGEEASEFSGSAVLENNVIVSRLMPLAIHLYRPGAKGTASMELRNNTLIGSVPIVAYLHDLPDPAEKDHSPSICIESSSTIFQGLHIAAALRFEQTAQLVDKGKAVSAAEMERFLPRLISWREQRNLYASKAPFLDLAVLAKSIPSTVGTKTLGDWTKLWGLDVTGSLEGELQFESGDFFAKAHLTPELTKAADFRLHPGSAGHRAGNDGKDLGADLDLVGPGAAYERWKQTPEYQQWLKDTGQVKRQEDNQQTKSFVVLGNKEISERPFATLADAVAAASSGDTIEIRGNGPFDSPPLVIPVNGLTIRAGAGSVPLIRLKSEEASPALISNSMGKLVLEGLDLRLAGFPADAHGPGPRILHCGGYARTCITNCNLHVSGRGRPLRVEDARSLVELRNVALGGSIWFDGARLVAENSISFSPRGSVCQVPADSRTEHSLQWQRCTLVANQVVEFLDGIGATIPDHAPHHVQFNVARCILDGHDCIVSYVPWARVRGGQPKLSAEARSELLLAAFKRRVSWQAEQNVYSADTYLLGRPEMPVAQNRIKTLEGWNEYWGVVEQGSVQGVVRFEADDLSNAVIPTPDTFRLRPESAGYRAGPNGEDLGADVDLVGPGAAYERWKLTPEYQQWLKDTEQVK